MFVLLGPIILAATGSSLSAMAAAAIASTVLSIVGIVVGLGVGLGVALGNMPKVPNATAGAPVTSDLQLNTCEYGTPIPDVIGTSKCNAQVVQFGPEWSMKVYQSEGVLGRIDWHAFWPVSICKGPVDELLAIYKDEKLIWSGSLTPADADENGMVEFYTIVNTFGRIHFYFGTADQNSDSILGTKLDDPEFNNPFRGVCWAYSCDGFMGQTRRAPSLKFMVRKSPTAPWDPDNTYQRIDTYDSNPMHALWYLMTEAKIPASFLGQDEFLACAQTLYNESLGVQIYIDGSRDYLYYIDSLLKHIRGLITDETPGKLCPKLIRDDWSINDLPIITEDHVLATPNIPRPGWLTTTNEVKAEYSQRLTGSPESYCHWAFETFDSYTLVDSDGYSNFTPWQSSTPNYELLAGQTGNAIRSTGIQGQLYSEADFSIFNKTFSYSLPVRFDWYQDSGVMYGAHELTVGYPGVNGFKIVVRANSNHTLWAYAYIGNGNYIEINNYSTGITNGEWFRVTFTVDMDSAIKIYVGKTEVATFTPINDEIPFDADGGLYGSGEGLWPFFYLWCYNAVRQTIAIDEAKMFDTCLTASQVGDLVDGRIGGMNFINNVSSPPALDPANVEIQGQYVTDTIQVPFFTKNHSACWAAEKHLLEKSYPAEPFDLSLNRYGYMLKVGGRFRFYYKPYGIKNLVLRVVNKTEESIEKEEIRVTVIEEPYGLVSSVSSFEDPVDHRPATPSQSLDPLANVGLIEAPYSISGQDIRLIGLAGKNLGSETGFYLFQSQDGTDFESIASVERYTPHGSLVADYGSDTYQVDDRIGFQVDLTLALDAELIASVTRSQMYAGRNMFLITDGTNHELGCFQTWTQVSGSRYAASGIIRGMFDTQKMDWSAGADFYYLGNLSNIETVDSAEFIYGASRYFRLVPYGVGTGDVDDAESISHTFAGRSYTPHRPANFMCNGSGVGRYSSNCVLTWRGAIRAYPEIDEFFSDVATEYEGVFELQMIEGAAVTDSVDDLAALTYTFVPTLGGDVTFKIRNKITTNGVEYASDWVELEAMAA